MPYKDKYMYKKSQTILRWKRKGIIYHNYDELYERFLSQEKCEKCECILTRGKTCYSRITTDHDHSIIDNDNFRMFLCNCCNINMKDRNVRSDSKTGEKYIFKHQGKYRARKNGKYDKCFNTIEEAILFRNSE